MSETSTHPPLDTPGANDGASAQMSKALRLFNHGDYKSARQHQESADGEEATFIKSALAWDHHLTVSIIVFAVIWASAVYATCF